MKFHNFFPTFVGHFCPPGSGSNPDPDPQPWFLGINSSLLDLEFLSGFLPSFFRSTKCYPWTDSSFLASWIFVRIFKTRKVIKVDNSKHKQKTSPGTVSVYGTGRRRPPYGSASLLDVPHRRRSLPLQSPPGRPLSVYVRRTSLLLLRGRRHYCRRLTQL